METGDNGNRNHIGGITNDNAANQVSFINSKIKALDILLCDGQPDVKKLYGNNFSSL